MSQIRLIGLVLFITAIFLTLAAGLTQTTHIRLKRPESRSGNMVEETPNIPSTGTPPLDSPPGAPQETQPPAEPPRPQVEFMSIPIAWPLLVAGGLGLLIWFSTAPRLPTKPPRRRRKRRRK
jgi:hypothetical protein